jgi:hypothetical protein
VAPVQSNLTGAQHREWRLTMLPEDTTSTPICSEPGCTEPAWQGATPHGRAYYRSICLNHWADRNREGIHQRTGYRSTEDGAQYLETDGYVRVRRNGAWVKRSRAILEGIIGRPLRPGETAHHRNGVRHDDRPENLELWVGPVRAGVRAQDLRCPHCGEPYLTRPEPWQRNAGELPPL